MGTSLGERSGWERFSFVAKVGKGVVGRYGWVGWVSKRRRSRGLRKWRHHLVGYVRRIWRVERYEAGARESVAESEARKERRDTG